MKIKKINIMKYIIIQIQIKLYNVMYITYLARHDGVEGKFENVIDLQKLGRLKQLIGLMKREGTYHTKI